MKRLHSDWVRPHCFFCKSLVLRGLPCTCERAQEEARRIMGDRR